MQTLRNKADMLACVKIKISIQQYIKELKAK